MDLEREIKVRDAIKYCIENFDSKTATNRIVEFWKDELKLQEQAINYSQSCKSDSEQLVCEKCNGTGGYSYTDNIGFNYKTCECKTN